VKKNRREVYQLMFKAASQTILTLAADPKRLGGKAGLILMRKRASKAGVSCSH